MGPNASRRGAAAGIDPARLMNQFANEFKPSDPREHGERTPTIPVGTDMRCSGSVDRGLGRFGPSGRRRVEWQACATSHAGGGTFSTLFCEPGVRAALSPRRLS